MKTIKSALIYEYGWIHDEHSSQNAWNVHQEPYIKEKALMTLNTNGDLEVKHQYFDCEGKITDEYEATYFKPFIIRLEYKK